MNWLKIGKWIFGSLGILSLLFLVFISSPSLLQIFSMMLFVLTLGAILDAKGTGTAKACKVLLYVLYFIYSLYSLNIFLNFENLTLADWNKIIFGIVAPICMVIVGKWLSSRKIKGHKILNTAVLWGLFLVIAVIWHFLYPGEVILEWIIVYWLVSLGISIHFKNKHYGGKNQNG